MLFTYVFLIIVDLHIPIVLCVVHYPRSKHLFPDIPLAYTVCVVFETLLQNVLRNN